MVSLAIGCWLATERDRARMIPITRSLIVFARLPLKGLPSFASTSVAIKCILLLTSLKFMEHLFARSTRLNSQRVSLLTYVKSRTASLSAGFLLYNSQEFPVRLLIGKCFSLVSISRPFWYSLCALNSALALLKFNWPEILILLVEDCGLFPVAT